jgi:hypothetical protein
MRVFTAKTAKESANRGPADPHGFNQPASPVDTRTAERTFARNQLNFHQQKTCFLLMKMKFVFIWAVIRSAVLYSA